MRPLAALHLAAALFVTAAPARAEAPAPPEVDDTWTPLFDGKTLGGWEVLWPEFWTVEDGAIRVQTPDTQTWEVPKLSGGYSNFNYIRTREDLPSFHLALEIRVVRGKFGIAHWGTLKKSLSDAFFYGHAGWNEVRMTWHAGKVLLFWNGDVWDSTADARQGENRGRVFLYAFPATEVWFRNIRVKRIGRG